MLNLFLSVIIPVYNEAEVIERVVQDHIQILEGLEPSIEKWEIVCLNDASTDQSGAILEKLSQKFNSLRVITHPNNKGIQASFMRLHQEALGTHIYHTGGDNQWPAENLKRLLNTLKEKNLDYVIGVRENRRKVYSLWRKLLSYGYNFLPQLFFQTTTKDSNGIKLGRREIFQIPLISRSFFAEIERVVEAKRKGYKIGFASVDFLPRSKGKAQGAKWKYIRGTLFDFIRYLFSRILNKGMSAG